MMDNRNRSTGNDNRTIFWTFLDKVDVFESLVATIERKQAETRPNEEPVTPGLENVYEPEYACSHRCRTRVELDLEPMSGPTRDLFQENV